MPGFEKVLSDVFDRRSETAVLSDSPVGARLTLADEVAAIADVKGGGSDGIVALVYAYAPALRGAVSRYRESLGEDARAVAVAALVEACHAVTPGTPLAGVLPEYLTNALMTATGETSSVVVPTRTLKRFLSIVRRADGDLAAAADLAPEFSMNRETFLAVAAATWGWESLESVGLRRGDDDSAVEPEASPLWDDRGEFALAEDRLMVEIAFASVDDEERKVTRAAYGFAAYKPLSDGEIAEEMPFLGSRAKVQRTRTRALSKLRDSLGLVAEDLA